MAEVLFQVDSSLSPEVSAVAALAAAVAVVASVVLAAAEVSAAVEPQEVGKNRRIM